MRTILRKYFYIVVVIIFHNYKRRVPGGKIAQGVILVNAKMNWHQIADVPKGSLDITVK